MTFRLRAALLLALASLAGCEYCATITHNLQQQCLDGDQESCEVLQRNAPAPFCEV